VIAVKDLLAKAGITAKAIAQHSVNQQTWQEFLARTLPEGLAAHVTGISLQRGTLTVLADLPGWAVRLRYALEEALPRIREQDQNVHRVLVKVAER
jgi:predicted nucleic acid-binding Zn ribbon protein